jgi:hypothetical protein
MQYEVTGVPDTLDLSLFTCLLTDADPAALADLVPDSRTLRMSTVLTAPALLGLLGRSGVAVDDAVVRQLPSHCSGGCGG